MLGYLFFSFQDNSDTSMSSLGVKPNSNPSDRADLCVKSIERQKVYGLSKSHSGRGRIFSSCEASCFTESSYEIEVLFNRKIKTV